MKKKMFIVSLVISFVMICSLLSISAWAQASKYRKVDKQGEANIIFSSQQIKLNMESSVILKDTFKAGEPIFARVYFPGPVGKLQKGERLLCDLWIDEQFAGRTSFATVDPSWDTIQLMVNNTGKDEFNADLFSGLVKGKHKMQIFVGREGFMKQKYVGERVDDKIKVSKENVYTAKYLSRGVFFYLVE